MRNRINALLGSFALMVFAWTTAAQATNLSELPLKVSALAKPNVIFGMDDSGSMDWEMVLDTSSGTAYWDGTSAWDSTNNRPLRTSSYVPMTYLFPVGTATGGQIYAYNSWWGQSVPPTAQFAWLRASAFNNLFYNTQTTYAPWAPAYVSGALQSYGSASSTAAKSHPAVSAAPTLNLTTDWNSSNGSFTSNGNMFYVQAGMVLPAGTQTWTTDAGATGQACTAGSWQTLTAAQTVPAGRACWAAMVYYPATFWHSESCTVDSSTCVNAPNGSGTLKRYEIKSGNTFPSGRTYAAEMQNFANWFTYHRKRKLMLAAAMGKVLEPMTGLRMGVVPFNNRGTVTMLDADSTTSSTNRYATAGSFYLNSMSANGTPTHATMAHIADQFNANTNVVQYACQRNSMFVVTDGFANAHSTTAPSYNAATYGSGAPYTTIYANSLADLALAYYTNQLRTDLPAGLVPLGDPTRVNPVTNPNLHITTYGITLGARGTLNSGAANPFGTNVFTTPPTWPTPVADDPTMVDDLWHATINGRGLMFLANDATAMGQAIQSAFDDILNQAGAQASIGVSSVNLGRGDDFAYLGKYNLRGWSGDLTRNAVSTTTGAISTSASWAAAALLAARDWTTRLIFTSDNSTGLDFTVANVGGTVNPDSATYTNTQVVEWMRGSRVGEGTTVRARTSLIGAVVNAEPVVSRADGVVYLASGEGLLHAFDTATGAELWAYHPSDTLASAGASVARGWVFKTQLDATPTLAQLASGAKMLVGGLGAAGRSYYALDVSNPRPANATAAAAQFKWIFPATTDTTNRGLMGYAIGRPVVTKTSADGAVALVTSGYDNGVTLGDGKGRVWMLNAATGAVIKTFRTTEGSVGSEAGLAHISAMKELDGTTKYAYGGDLLGNVWKFDLTKAGAGPHDAELVATLYDSSNNRQPVTAAPELVTMGSKRVILVGTGRVLDIGDFGSTRTQSFYAIADGTTLANARDGLTQRTYTRAADNGTAESTPLAGSSFDWTTGRGWYFDLPAGEQANTVPVVTYGTVAFVTNKNGTSDCSQSSWLYLVDIGSGKKVPGSTFAATLISNTANSSRLITLRTVDGKIFGTSHRSDDTVYQRQLPLGTTIPPSKNAWRELRR
ncbi:MAG: PQQ-binding-like beta-propeller repeat protein [Burkholderiales bacterium]|nr:PQQ-binding-like beta-propeller repeat protein [Burkholderiales bacterium]